MDAIGGVIRMALATRPTSPVAGPVTHRASEYAYNDGGPYLPNIIKYSGALDNAAWTKFTATVTAQSDGEYDLCNITSISGGVYQASVPVTAEATYTVSFDARLPSSGAFDQTPTLALYNGTAGAFFEENVAYTAITGGYTRNSHTFTIPAGCSQIRVYVLRRTVNGTGGVLIGRVMLNAGDFAAPYRKRET